jgi:hypothetical protein
MLCYNAIFKILGRAHRRVRARHFEDFLKPLIEEIPTVEVKRAEAIRGDILNEIIKELVVSPIVVADLTDANPNVYWELGVRQSFKHGTVTIIEGEPKLPFDIGGKGTLAYFPTNHTKNANFTRQLKLVIGQILQHPKDPDSRVLEAISGRGSLFEIFQVDQAVRRIDALRSEYTGNAKLLEKVLRHQEFREGELWQTGRFMELDISLSSSREKHGQ